MKTINIRLSDNEAIALDRLAYVNGVSKNRQITSLIVQAYRDIDPISGIMKDTVLYMENEYDWATVTCDMMCGGVDESECSKDKLEIGVKIAQHALENGEGLSDSQISEIEKLRNDLMSKYAYAIKNEKVQK